MSEEIPDFQTIMLPLLQLAEQGELSIGDAIPQLADQFGLTDEQRSELLPSGRQARFANRANWAKSYLGKAALLHFTGRGRFRASPRGKQVCVSPPSRITINWLMQFPEFQAFKAGGSAVVEPATINAEDCLTPDEQMRAARDRIDADLSEQILNRIIAGTPAFFERLVVRLVTAMGYGGSIADAGRALGQSGDGGVDGVIDEDALGLDRIYVQAKRYAAGNPVGPGAIRDFFGALDQFKANKGLLVTTSSFTTSAKATAEGLSKRIVLIDGTRLAALMIRYDVGCRVEEVLTIKKSTKSFMANSRNEPPSGIRSPTKDDSRKGEEVVRDEDDDSDDPYAAFTEWADEIDAVWDDWPMPTAP